MKKISPLLLVIVSGLLLFAGWSPSPFTFLVFIAFVPLLWLEREIAGRGKFLALTYLTLLAWNLVTTWWVCNSTLVGGIAAILANSLLMCIPWIGFRNVKKRMGAKIGYPALVVFWLCFEYIHLNWELSWPWLTLGNSFASRPDWVQWYEFTGTSGGSLWILTINILAFRCLFPSTGNRRTPAVWLAALLIIPLAFSWSLKPSETGTLAPADSTTGAAVNSAVAGRSYNVVIVQPNIDPWDEKFVAGKQETQLQKLIQLSESRIDNNTSLVVWPETAVPVAINEDEMKSNYFMAPVWDFLRKHPSINLLTGVEGFRIYNQQNKTPYSTRIPESDKYAETYNSAVLMDSGSFQVYHKSRLVPGVEVLPSFLRF
ncbi:MAG TPA: nitrilase-related carbon-nitrogen hydrolase, partial [Puia sp.]|nr:nitrilase-related carbon-nitrogen hydrolase [Puia sp.]